MPTGIQRLNAKKSQPNSLIVFIKPLKGPDEATAQDFLERIAAQCLPIMREHHISVMSLEEYEPNREFVGRNFNAGEVIQLVLKSTSTGRWLPFNYVQMVMMHELAHCKQMNHSRAFWAVRNKYAEGMRQLWSRGYTGEGLWGRGALLTTGEFETNTVQNGEALPEHLCGGTYRSRRRKRKAKEQLTYQQRKEQRILKKFGANGVALGEDEVVKAELEKGKRTQAKPRVAGSKRGRDLRAAAALARFGQQKETENSKSETEVKDEEDRTASESETASENEDDASEAKDFNGNRLLDGKGHRMIKVCEDDNPDDDDAQNELRELQSSVNSSRSKPPDPSFGKSSVVNQERGTRIRLRDLPSFEEATSSTSKQGLPLSSRSDIIKLEDDEDTEAQIAYNANHKKLLLRDANRDESKSRSHLKTNNETREAITGVAQCVPEAVVGVCPLCSTKNGPLSLTCALCAHVLDGRKDARAWKCTRLSCGGSQYLNAGDSGACGVCGERKLTS